MIRSESITQVSKALAVFHASMGVIRKTEDNPFFRSKYASLPNILSAIEKPLHEAGLVLTQIPENENELTTLVIHPESGEFIGGTYKMNPTPEYKRDTDKKIIPDSLHVSPQAVGSAITYQRRYAIGAVLNLNIDEDDDGNKASGNTTYTTSTNDYDI